jgi:hypothetical protein
MRKESMNDSEEMKGRRIKVDKLQLNRETVRDLTPDEQKGIKGGLVVSAIIGVVIALLLPAPQNPRDIR